MKLPLHRHFISGFTLIELLVVISIMVILVSGGIAGYIEFDENQSLREDAKRLQVILRSAQKKARVGDRPTGCEKLLNYGVRINNLNENILVTATCDNAGGQEMYVVSAEEFSDKVKPTANHWIKFKVLHGGVEYALGDGNIELSYNDGDKKYQFKVTAGGEISQGSLVPE